MDARLTNEQEQIQQTTREFLEGSGGIEFARRKMDEDDGVVDEVWEKLQGLDYPALTIPPDYGGLGEGMLFLAAVLEELGRYAMPGPYPETAAFAVPLIEALGSEKQQETYFEAIADDGHRMSFALYDDENEEVPEAIQMQAERTDDGFVLSGTKKLVPYGGEVDSLIVAARTQEATDERGITLFVVDADDIQATEKRSLDRTRPMYEVNFDDVTLDDSAVLGEPDTGGEALSEAIDRFNVAISAWLAGGAGRAVDMSADYANEREQYGQPIGRYQAVKHRIAEMWMDKEHMVTLAYYAAWAIDNSEPEAPRTAAMAKAFAASRMPRVFRDDIRNHGGMGYTWDHDGHIYLKQAKAWQNFLGSADYHLERIADMRDYSTRGLPDYPEITVEPYG